MSSGQQYREPPAELESKSFNNWLKYAKEHRKYIIAALVFEGLAIAVYGFSGGSPPGGILFFVLSLVAIVPLAMPLAAVNQNNIRTIHEIITHSAETKDVEKTLHDLEWAITNLKNDKYIVLLLGSSGPKAFFIPKSESENIFADIESAGRALCEEAISLASQGQFEEAKELLESVENVAEQVEQIATQMVETLKEKDDVKHPEVKDIVDETVDGLRELTELSRAKVDIQRGDRQRDSEFFEDAVSLYRDAYGTLTQYDSVDSAFMEQTEEKLVRAGVRYSEQTVDMAESLSNSAGEVDDTEKIEEVRSLLDDVVSLAESNHMEAEAVTAADLKQRASELTESAQQTQPENEATVEDAATTASGTQHRNGGTSPGSTKATAEPEPSSQRSASNVRGDENTGPVPHTEIFADYPVPAEIPSSPQFEATYKDFEQIGQIGSGGSADVFEAQIETDGGIETVAIKKPKMDETLHGETIEQFQEEAKTWDQLDDEPLIVEVIDWGPSPLPWIAMEYMDGDSLKSDIGSMDLPQALWTALCIIQGVYQAHEFGVAHTDLKPENILFRQTPDGTWNVPKIADWGVAKTLLAEDGSSNELSPYYAAPEQFDSDYGQPDKATDVYQLGVVFYELMTGQKPFATDTDPVQAVLEGDITPPSSVNGNLPAELGDVLLTALNKQKSNRYESILYFRDALEETAGQLV